MAPLLSHNLVYPQAPAALCLKAYAAFPARLVADRQADQFFRYFRQDTFLQLFAPSARAGGGLRLETVGENIPNAPNLKDFTRLGLGKWCLEPEPH